MTREALIEVMARAIYDFEPWISLPGSDSERILTWDEAREADMGGYTIDIWAQAELALSALEAAGVRLVPAQPTEDQFRAGSAFRMAAETHGYRDTEGLYLAMLAASPYAPQKDETK